MTEQEVAQVIKEQVDKLELIKIINVYSLNVDVKKMKRQATNCENILANHISDKGLIARIKSSQNQ